MYFFFNLSPFAANLSYFNLCVDPNQYPFGIRIRIHKIAEFLVNTDPIWKSGFGSTLLRMYPLTWCVPSSRECGRISGVAS